MNEMIISLSSTTLPSALLDDDLALPPPSLPPSFPQINRFTSHEMLGSSLVFQGKDILSTLLTLRH
jgi:hypothetical protein